MQNSNRSALLSAVVPHPLGLVRPTKRRGSLSLCTYNIPGSSWTWVSWLDYPTLRKQASIGHPLDVLGRYCNRLLNLLPNQWILLRGIIKCVLKLDQREGLLYAAACSLEKVPGKKRY